MLYCLQITMSYSVVIIGIVLMASVILSVALPFIPTSASELNIEKRMPMMNEGYSHDNSYLDVLYSTENVQIGETPIIVNSSQLAGDIKRNDTGRPAISTTDDNTTDAGLETKAKRRSANTTQ